MSLIKPMADWESLLVFVFGYGTPVCNARVPVMTTALLMLLALLAATHCWDNHQNLQGVYTKNLNFQNGMCTSACMVFQACFPRVPRPDLSVVNAHALPCSYSVPKELDLCGVGICSGRVT